MVLYFDQKFKTKLNIVKSRKEIREFMGRQSPSKNKNEGTSSGSEGTSLLLGSWRLLLIARVKAVFFDLVFLLDSAIPPEPVVEVNHYPPANMMSVFLDTVGRRTKGIGEAVCDPKPLTLHCWQQVLYALVTSFCV